MCVICASKRGVRQPTETELRDMFYTNPDGAGYMFQKGKYVVIKKGFMNVEDYIASIKAEKFTKDDVVIYHLRISTQAGVNKEMTQPFPISHSGNALRSTTTKSKWGMCHNGIISLTTDRTEKTYSDTALFILNYLPDILDNQPSRLYKASTQSLIKKLTASKTCYLDGNTGNIITIGNFTTKADGLIYSNLNHEYSTGKYYTSWGKKFGDYKSYCYGCSAK